MIHILLVCIVAIQSIGQSMHGAAVPSSGGVALTIGGSSIYSVPSAIAEKLQAIKNKTKYPIDLLQGVIPNLEATIKNWFEVANSLYENKLKTFDAQLEKMSYTELVQFSQLCNYFGAQEINDYLFGVPKQELKGGVVQEKETPKFIPLLFDKAKALDLPAMLMPFIRKSGSVMATNDSIPASERTKQLLISYVQENVLPARAFGPEHMVSVPVDIRAAFKLEVDPVSWSSENVLAISNYGGGKKADDIDLFTIDKSVPTFLQRISWEYPDPSWLVGKGSATTFKGKQLIDQFVIRNIKWSPNGKLFAVSRDCDLDVYEKNGTIKQYRILSDIQKTGIDGISGLGWSPDSTTLAVATFVKRKEGKITFRDTTITLLRKQSTDEWVKIQLLSLPSIRDSQLTVSIAWNPNGQTIAILHGDDNIYFFHKEKEFVVGAIEPAPSYPTLTGKFNYLYAKRAGLAWSPDGKTLAFLEESVEGATSRPKTSNMASDINIQYALVCMKQASPGPYTKNIQRDLIPFDVPIRRKGFLLSWSPNGKKIGIAGVFKNIPFTGVFEIASNALIPLVDYSKKLSQSGVITYDLVKVFHWDSDSMISLLDDSGTILSVILPDIDFLKECSINQLFILLITQTIQNGVPYGQKAVLRAPGSVGGPTFGAPLVVEPKIKANLPFLQGIFKTFSVPAQKEISDFMPELIAKPITSSAAPSAVASAPSGAPSSVTPPSASSSGLGIKKSLQQLAQDMNTVAQKI